MVMKIAVWHSGHEISDTVCNAAKEGLPQADLIWSHQDNYMTKIKDYDLHIAYGILRGCGEVFKQAESFGIPWVELDRGFWKPGHYDGYYRISLNGTQQTTGLNKLKPDYERWDKLGLEILPAKEPRPDFCLICPPTEYVQDFFGKWKVEIPVERTWKYRSKDDATQLQDDLNKASEIVTFNSSVGWEALRQGIPVVSDPNHSIIGAYRKMVDKDISKDLDERRKLFALMSSLQLTLEEMRSGKLWPLLQKLLQFT